MNRNIQTFIAADSEYQDAQIVLFGAPFDGTTSFRPGTRFGPSAIRSESYGIETYSPYLDLDLTDRKICDIGDLELPFGNTVSVLNQIEAVTKTILNDAKLPLMLGGEHLITLAAVRAAAQTYPDLVVIQLDAHTDLRDTYLGEPLSHSTVIRRIWDILGDNRIYQFGIRSGEKYEFDFAAKHTHIQKFNFDGFQEQVAGIGGRPVYLTLDLDVLDPGIFPGTGTPEAGGVSFLEIIKVIECLKELNVIACDINELSPTYDPSGVSTAMACKLTREILLTL